MRLNHKEIVSLSNLKTDKSNQSIGNMESSYLNDRELKSGFSNLFRAKHGLDS